MKYDGRIDIICPFLLKHYIIFAFCLNTGDAKYCAVPYASLEWKLSTLWIAFHTHILVGHFLILMNFNQPNQKRLLVLEVLHPENFSAKPTVAFFLSP